MDSHDVERYADAAARAIGLDLAPTHRDGVVAQLAGLLEAARLFTEFPLADEVEPAPVFEP